MKFENFKKILDSQIFDNSKIDLLVKIANYPNRYLGLFGPTKPKSKILQNLLQSNEIKFGDAFEKLFYNYFQELGYKNLENIIENIDERKRKEFLNLDQLFTDGKYIYFVEQKIRDDHDSTKKRGQFENFEKKLLLC